MDNTDTASVTDNEAPHSSKDLFESVADFRTWLNSLRNAVPAPSQGWYPYDSTSAVDILSDVLTPSFAEMWTAIKDLPLLDIGCADGDFSLLFARWGFEVDAVDSAKNNFNGLEGARSLAQHSEGRVTVYDIDLDGRFEFPQKEYGLTLFLGTLYHLKSPYYVLESLAFRSKWCILSTRVAQQTPRVNAYIDSEPMAYLADGREINNDATNYWIFSGAGLLRIVQRTRWAVRGVLRAGCLRDSDPIDSDRDERMFLLLQSRVFYPTLAVRKGYGWYEPEESGWGWTAKQFSISVVLPLETPCPGFDLAFYVPAELVRAGKLSLECSIRTEVVGYVEAHQEGFMTMKAGLPDFALHEPILTLVFTVEHGFQGESRDLGVFVPGSKQLVSQGPAGAAANSRGTTRSAVPDGQNLRGTLEAQGPAGAAPNSRGTTPSAVPDGQGPFRLWPIT